MEAFYYFKEKHLPYIVIYTKNVNIWWTWSFYWNDISFMIAFFKICKGTNTVWTKVYLFPDYLKESYCSNFFINIFPTKDRKPCQVCKLFILVWMRSERIQTDTYIWSRWENNRRGCQNQMQMKADICTPSFLCIFNLYFFIKLWFPFRFSECQSFLNFFFLTLHKKFL